MIAAVIEYFTHHEVLVFWLTGISIFTFVGTLIVVPWLIINMPVDYFTHGSRRRTRQGKSQPLLKIVILIIKNVLGAILVITGFIMLFIPGQGLLTIAIGLALLDFPGKYTVERWVVTRGPIRRSINRIRRRAGRPPV
jgi:archaellum biogenesis protein FlaJ (TadC family)